MNLYYLLVPVALMAASAVLSFVLVKRGTRMKKVLSINLLTFIAILALSIMIPFGASAETSATQANTTTQSQTADTKDAGVGAGLKYIGAALSVGIGAIGGGIAVAAGAPAAIGASVEDPKSAGKSIIFVALGEGFGLYGMVVGILCLLL